ncbi:MAG: IS5 family transposase [Flavobacteriaceae bacterium]|nr:IS5 family transposase [Flavobacteriaceae bacterium]
MIKYTPTNQLTLDMFSHPFEKELLPNNRWVKLSKVIPWDELAGVYAKQLDSNFGRESIDIRMVIGALIVKHKMGLDDRGTVEMISENIYLQYFCGLSSFQTKNPFHPTVFVDIRKRMGASSFDKWNELVIEKADQIKPKSKKQITENQDKEKVVKNKGVLKIDATVANQKIAFPTDAGLLNVSRLESERLIDALFKQSSLTKKPRTYRKIARNEYLNFSKKRRKTKKEIRKFIRKHLEYLKRNIAHINSLLDNIEVKKQKQNEGGAFSGNFDSHPYRFPLPKKDQKLFWVMQLLYKQQKFMYDEKKHSVANRIVNIYQPYVRPIPRGKDKVSTEFGAKISASEVDGMSRVEHISWDNFNESKDLVLQIEMFKKTYGHYPELLLADRIYLNRENRKWLKSKNIRIVGKPLGRPPKEQLNAYQKRKRKKEQNQRNLIEGKFGQGKNAYGLSNIQAKRNDTSESWISAIFFIMNLLTLVKIADKYAIFCAFFKKHISIIYLKIYNKIIFQKRFYNFNETNALRMCINVRS